MNKFTVNTITFLDQIIDNKLLNQHYIFKYFDNLSIWLFLNSLDENKIYCIYPELINLEYKYELNPVLKLSNPFLVCKDSNEVIIYKFIINQIDKSINLYNISDPISWVDNHDKLNIIFRFHEVPPFF